jgi:N-acetylmuramoyl-L-alanine amidase
VAAGYLQPNRAEPGVLCPVTEAALCSFQTSRGLHATGVCDQHSWTALVEAGWKLGDRLLSVTTPNLRGDDVSDVQHQLTRLGFDCGRVDGIYGPLTAHAVHDFQENVGLATDGVVGPDTVTALRRVIGQTGSGPGVGVLREQELLRRGVRSLAKARIAVGQFGGLSSLTRMLTRELRHLNASVMSLDEPDPLVQARAANTYGADVYIGFEAAQPGAVQHSVIHFYEVEAFVSTGGRALADLIAVELASPMDVTSARGMRLPVLRETKMPAVLVSIGSVTTALGSAPRCSAACVRALELWVTSREG